MARPPFARSAGLLALGVALSGARADLPVHCLHPQIRGRWRFHLGPLAAASGAPARACGHHLPGSKEDVMADPSARVVNATPYDLALADPDLVTDAHGLRGFWTMVYDEGFEVRAVCRGRGATPPRDSIAPHALLTCGLHCAIRRCASVPASSSPSRGSIARATRTTTHQSRRKTPPATLQARQRRHPPG